VAEPARARTHGRLTARRIRVFSEPHHPDRVFFGGHRLPHAVVRVILPRARRCDRDCDDDDSGRVVLPSHTLYYHMYIYMYIVIDPTFHRHRHRHRHRSSLRPPHNATRRRREGID
jgi:hypothetical protein